MNQTLPDNKVLYKALVEKDSTYDGIFVVGVKSTGIFCRPTCNARKPKIENVEFFRTPKEALQRGYRPCKLCHPLGYKDRIPDWLVPLLKEIDSDPSIRLKDSDLIGRGLEPNRVRRWFKKHHDMTFQAYLRSLRIGLALGRIKQGDKVIEAAFNSGYESLSGFTNYFKKTFGRSPANSKNKQIISVTRILTPLGPMIAGVVDKGICLLEFADRRMIETQFKRLRRALDAEIIPGPSPLFDKLDLQLKEYFEGRRRNFEIPLVIPGTEFQRKVWEVLQTIPYGTTRSYREQAGLLGRPEAIRAVARTNGDNRIAILIPCHRVIGSDGQLTGYGGGLWRKRYLLDLEKAALKQQENHNI
nr:bifunctional transcriptional activator/DNA repair protein Ada [candidate division Zixibacteria bacterium]